MLLVFCLDQVGIIVWVFGFIVGYGGWIFELSFYFDVLISCYFMCIEIKVDLLFFLFVEFCECFGNEVVELL